MTSEHQSSLLTSSLWAHHTSDAGFTKISHAICLPKKKVADIKAAHMARYEKEMNENVQSKDYLVVLAKEHLVEAHTHPAILTALRNNVRPTLV